MRRALMIGTTLACLGLAASALAQPQGGVGNNRPYATSHPVMAAPPPPPRPAAAMIAPAPPLEYDIGSARKAIDDARAAHKIGPHMAHRLERRLKVVERELLQLSHEVAAISRSLPAQ